MSLKQLSEIDFSVLTTSRSYFPSPIAWEDQAFYFLLLDRFSDGHENGYRDNQGNLVRTGSTPLYTPADWENALKTEKETGTGGTQVLAM